jgi:hypothetical protein
MKRGIKISIILALVLLIGSSFIGCGGGSSGGDANPNPSTGNTWDTMEWDKGQWG